MNDAQTIEELAGERVSLTVNDMISRHALLLLFYTEVLHWRERNAAMLDFKRPLIVCRIEACLRPQACVPALCY